MRVRGIYLLRSGLHLLLAGLVVGVMPTFGAEKKILLRAETITPSGVARQSLRSMADEPVSGLYLIQLADSLPDDWEAQLASCNVKLLRPVPEDAYVARLSRTLPSKIDALGFINYFGPYKPEHKTLPGLKALAEQPSSKLAQVRVLLPADANPIDTARLQRRFNVLSRYEKTRFGKLLEGSIAPERLKAVLQSDAVLWVEPAPKPKLFDAVADEIIEGEGVNGIPAVQDIGFTGKGVTVAVADSGLDLGTADLIHPDLEGRVDAFFYYGNLTDASDEHSHGTHVTGIIAGNGATGETDENGYLYGLGVAPEAHIVAQRIFDGVGGYEPPASMDILTTDAVRSGAVIGSNSWGDDTQGRYDTSAMQFDALVRDADPNTPGDQPYILEFSAGNAGPAERTIGSPAVAKNVIATGASQNNRFDFFIYADGQETMADFSSRGPCEDGRIKPDVVAPGTWISSLQSSAASDENAWLAIDQFYQYQGGTSQAGPHASGAAAVFVQYYRETHNGKTPSPALVKAALINSAVDMDNDIAIGLGGTGYVPNNHEGWGRVDMTELIGSNRGYDFTDQTALLTNGQSFEKRFYLASSDEPLKVTLAYTDVPGFPPAIPALVNDLDLEVQAPNGDIFAGNQFIEGKSIPNPGSSDSINNVEGIYIDLPAPGEYIVRVKAHKVLEDSRKDTPAQDQDFALVISGDVPLPGQGVLAFDKRAYTYPDTIAIKLIDFDLAGKPNATISLATSTQTIPISVTLQPSGNLGVFTGAVQTALSPVQNDGRLHLAHGDTITGTYNDSSPNNLVQAVATADLLAPIITNVSATNHFGRELISWSTDEPATSFVYYRSNTTGAFIPVSKPLFKTNHEVQVEHLVEGMSYQYYVVSKDEAGNVATNNNNGVFYSFVAQPASTILLVNAYTYTPDDIRDDVEIPVTAYTDALDQTGVSYEVWEPSREGMPTLQDLKPFRIVIWRINDSFYESANTIDSASQQVITDYLSNGGSFLMASMDILSRIGEVPFRTNVLQVASFKIHSDPLDECPDCDEDHQVSVITGAKRDSLTSGIEAPLDYGNYPVYQLEPVAPDIGPDLSDVFVPTTNAVPLFFAPDGKVTAIRYPQTGKDSDGRVAFLAFPLDAIPLDSPAPNNRATILRNLISFLAPGLNGFGSISLDNTTYTAPARVVVEVADSDLVGSASINIFASNTTSRASTTLDLRPTGLPGVFRGNLVLFRDNQSPGQGRLTVADGDQIVVQYTDATSHSILRASADIDLGIPEISDVSVVADYENAAISWSTDEPADALVQFGESTFLGKTAYVSTQSDTHEVLLTSLVPDRLYYFQVVSRDSAGNTVTDDNGGKLYTFRTLKPILPPWFDNLEGDTNEWSVQDGEDTEATWQFGVPNNSLATEAHSPTHAWGINLDGMSSGSYVQTFLLSPAFDLSGGNIATLKFWHNYDFSADSVLEVGQLLLFTNTQTQPVTLAQYGGDMTFGWEQEEFDLTPYIGKVVQLVWSYELFELEGNTHPGWLLDDVEVTVTNVFKGTLRVENNLTSAGFTLAGPATYTGTGAHYTNKIALAGTYAATWTDIPYYITPAPQTNTLAQNGELVFNGVYTFTDTNQNGIPDSWEMEQFQEVSASRNSGTDTDGDGATDFSEFIAGTDPNSKSSSLAVSDLQVLSNNRVHLVWSSVPGRRYQVLGSEDGRTWQRYGAEIIAAAEQSASDVLLPANSRSIMLKVLVSQ